MKVKVLAGLSIVSTLAALFGAQDTANAGKLTRTATYQLTGLDREVVPKNYQNQGFGIADILNSPLSIEKFNSKGKLKNVTIDFYGQIEADGGFESRDARSQTITASILGNFKLAMPNGVSLFNLNETASNVYQNLSRYDGKLDYTGTSGRTFEGITAVALAQKSFTDTNILQMFSGSGQLDFLFSALASSQFQGSGNISTYVDTFAKGSVAVTYEYEEARDVPEPGVALGVFVVAGLGLSKKGGRRKKEEASLPSES